MDNETDDIFTPEEIAWRLLLDENVNNVQLLAFSDENSVEILFEILLTIYLEMIYNHYKMEHLTSLSEDKNFDKNFDDNFNKYNLDLSKITLSTLIADFDKKFKKIKFILNINEISQEIFNEYKINRYCTILFRDLQRDSTFFIMNSTYLDPEKRYHFVKNSKYTNKTVLRDIFCSFELNGKYYKINFSEF